MRMTRRNAKWVAGLSSGQFFLPEQIRFEFLLKDQLCSTWTILKRSLEAMSDTLPSCTTSALIEIHNNVLLQLEIQSDSLRNPLHLSGSSRLFHYSPSVPGWRHSCLLSWPNAGLEALLGACETQWGWLVGSGKPYIPSSHWNAHSGVHLPSSCLWASEHCRDVNESRSAAKP